MNSLAPLPEMVVEVVNGNLSITNWDEESGLKEIQNFVGGAIEAVPVSADDLSFIGFCNADATRLKANCTVEGHEGVIYGPLVVLGCDENGEHRLLTFNEAAAFELHLEGPEFLPVLRLARS